ncbi:MAG: riboflavin synthase [Saprospiraceae bacterium]|nr:riboflavin synthase [Saprospiraceae bacterium]MBK7789198.1 riboflavin synthase [Saprospiraceae bacterium]MBK8852158.1 riboflavin synthase [Saprospiraceae bacterium]
MFSGIIEKTARVLSIVEEGSNHHFTMENPFGNEVYIDQSIAHNGTCLTVVDIDPSWSWYKVTAVKETLDKTNLGSWQAASLVNLERCIKADARMDGHFVQGHVDLTTPCLDIKDENGSWRFTFELPLLQRHLVVDKGSIAINGTSLTVILMPGNDAIFQVAIIPFTYEFTNFHVLKVGDRANLEFDILGKYISRFVEVRDSQ